MYPYYYYITLVFVFLLSGCAGLDQYIEDVDRFPGWRGELPSTLLAEIHDSIGYGQLGKVGLLRITLAGDLLVSYAVKLCCVPAGGLARQGRAAFLGTPCISVS